MRAKGLDGIKETCRRKRPYSELKSKREKDYLQKPKTDMNKVRARNIAKQMNIRQVTDVGKGTFRLVRAEVDENNNAWKN